MNPWLIIAALLAVASAGGIGYGAGHKAATNTAKAEQLKAERKAHDNYVDGVKRAIEQADQIAAENAEAESAGVQRSARIERVFQTINHEVNRYVQTDAGHGLCFDADGLRLYNAANRGDFPAPDQATPSGGVPRAVPGPAPGGGRLPGGSPADQQGSGAGILSLPGQAPGAGGMDQAQP